MLKLIKQESPNRLRDKDKKPYIDFYLTWDYQGQEYQVRVKPQFVRDYDKLFAIAETHTLPMKSDK